MANRLFETNFRNNHNLPVIVIIKVWLPAPYRGKIKATPYEVTFIDDVIRWNLPR